jgi:hypothetical protein
MPRCLHQTDFLLIVLVAPLLVHPPRNEHWDRERDEHEQHRHRPGPEDRGGHSKRIPDSGIAAAMHHYFTDTITSPRVWARPRWLQLSAIAGGSGPPSRRGLSGVTSMRPCTSAFSEKA